MNECWKHINTTPIASENRSFTIYNCFEWLNRFKPAAKVANFGCAAKQRLRKDDLYMTEPFALLWALDATQVDVVEKEDIFVHNALYCLDVLQKRIPHCFEQRQIKIIHGDMTKRVLASNEYDLAFCEHVLTYTRLRGFQAMVDCVRVGGIIAVIEYESTKLPKLAAKIPNIVPIEDIDKSVSPYKNEIYAYRKINN